MTIDRCGFPGVVSSLSVDGARAGWRASPRAGGVLWLTGLSGAGKTTLADAVAAQLRDRSVHPVVLDGDRLRTGLNRDLGFTVQDRFENVRRIAEVAALTSESGALAMFDERGATLTSVGEYRAPHAHTVAVDPATHRVYLPLQDVGGSPVLRILLPPPG